MTNNRTNTKKESLAEKLARQLADSWKIDLKKGTAPWSKPWYTVYKWCYSHETGHPYSIVNRALIAFSAVVAKEFNGIESIHGEYLTFLQVQKEGGRIKKGEHGHGICLVNAFNPKKKDGTPETFTNKGGEEELKMVKFLKAYTVFHVDQCEGIKPRFATRSNPIYTPQPVETRNPELDKIINTFCESRGIAFKERGEAAFTVGGVVVRVPKFERFQTAEAYYKTAFHELALVADGDRIKDYNDPQTQVVARIVSEISAALIMKHLNIQTDFTIENTSSYLEKFVSMLEDKPGIIFSILSRAEKAARLVLGLKEESEPETEPEPEPEPETEPTLEQKPMKKITFLVNKNKSCSQWAENPLPFKSIPAGSFIQLVKAGITYNVVKVFTSCEIYFATIKNFKYCSETDFEFPEIEKPERKPEPLRAILIEDDDEDDEEVIICRRAS